MLTMVRNVALGAAVAWAGLLLARGRFWDGRADRLAEPVASPPEVHAVVPARDEADVIDRTLASLIAQRYPGRFGVTVVDDRSVDGTGAVVGAVIAGLGAGGRVALVQSRRRPDGWTGKVWALSEGIAAAQAAGARPAYWWFTDADIEHAPDTLARLVGTAISGRRELVSEMVELHCDAPWERLLIPAFVFFFAMLYPFAWVGNARRRTAGAAGGCILIAEPWLHAIGGIVRIRGELIDDCALAGAVKRAGGRLWLGLSTRSRSVRPYLSLGTVWSMVARTAYTQLGYSPRLLAATVAAMAALYVVPPAAVVAGAATRRWDVAAAGAAGSLAMTIAYAPTVRLYRQPWWLALSLPLAGVLYTAMTVDSAFRHARGRGGTWKGRHFSPRPE
jgi:hopene-associated glycosyltransferase HpnB